MPGVHVQQRFDDRKCRHSSNGTRREECSLHPRGARPGFRNRIRRVSDPTGGLSRVYAPLAQRSIAVPSATVLFWRASRAAKRKATSAFATVVLQHPKTDWARREATTPPSCARFEILTFSKTRESPIGGKGPPCCAIASRSLTLRRS